MQWKDCYTDKRVGMKQQTSGARTQYQRDFDRLIFSSAFRRLQSKTQVFPLPGSTFVHNRLTHSLEVASVGRSLGAIVGSHIAETDIQQKNEDAFDFYRNDLSSIIAAGCLAHDIGNPAFGHSGENAISHFFHHFATEKIEGVKLQDFFSDHEWSDLTHFEGNANALRVLAQNFKGKVAGGLGLTMTTLASILKYPCDSLSIDKKIKHRKKYSFFQSEKAIFNEIIEELGFLKETGPQYSFKRHPFVYLVEAADDICYRIVDMEDAHRLKIISKEIISEAFMAVISDIDRNDDDMDRIYKTYKSLGDDNAAVSYLRAKSINTLTRQASDIFVDNKETILNGNYTNTLVDEIEESCRSLKQIKEISRNKIYNHDSVVEIEIAGFNVMSELLQLYVTAVLKEKRSPLDKQVLKLLPYQYTTYDDDISPYLKVMNVLDHVSAMTDVYATDFYRKVKGIEISKHK